MGFRFIRLFSSGLSRLAIASGFSLGLALSALAAEAPTTQPALPSPKGAITVQKPSAEFSPHEVIRIQLDALQHNDDPTPDSGIAKVFEFASPGNRAQTGPLPKFTAMVKGPAYLPMLEHKSAVYGPLQSDDHNAQQLVKITASDGTEAIYLFILSKQTDGTYKDCWMTDGVVRVKPEDLLPAPPAVPGHNGDGKDQA